MTRRTSNELLAEVDGGGLPEAAVNVTELIEDLVDARADIKHLLGCTGGVRRGPSWHECGVCPTCQRIREENK
jgi:hypothetical protein